MPTEDKKWESQATVAKDSGTSLLEDASTLLMFHNGAVSNTEADKGSKTEEKQSPPQPQPQTRPSPNPSTSSSTASTKATPPLGGSASLQPHASHHMASPGPAIAALAGSANNDDEKDKNQKAIVAAAALAAAAGVPFPLLNRVEQQGVSIDEHLRSSSTEVKEAVRATASEIPQDHIQALQETAKEIREKNKQDKDNDTFMKDNNDNDKQLQQQTQQQQQQEQQQQQIQQQTQQEQEQQQQPENKTTVKKTNGRKGKRKTSTDITSSVPKDYIVDPDLGVITCVCESEEDDGFTIQCDICYRWQHAICMDIDPDYVPEKYTCNVCQPRKVDVKRAKQLQAERMEALKNKDKEDNNNGDNATSSNNRASKDERSNSNKDGDFKDRSKPKPPNYGKNLEETVIVVPDSKNFFLTSFYTLETYDYQDELVYRYLNNLNTLEIPNSSHLSATEYRELQKPKISVKPYSDVNNKKFNGVSKLGLFTEEALKEDDLIEEYLGEVNFKDRYISDSRNHYRIWGVEKPQVSFVPNTPLVIDARFSGNLARFSRRSCNPNSEIKVVKIDDGSVKFFLVAKKFIKPNSELTVGWNWDPNHSIRKIIEGATFDQTNDTEKPSLVLSIESILTFVECACTSNSECALLKVKKASAHIYRSTRKGNNTSGLKLLTKDPQHVSIQERLLQREISNLRDSTENVTKLPIISTSNNTEAEIHIKPYIYSYLKKKRKLNAKDGKLDYLPIPLSMILNDEKKDFNLEKDNSVTEAPRTVKKLSFADYKKKKKPN